MHRRDIDNKNQLTDFLGFCSFYIQQQYRKSQSISDVKEIILLRCLYLYYSKGFSKLGKAIVIFGCLDSPASLWQLHACSSA